MRSLNPVEQAWWKRTPLRRGVAAGASDVLEAALRGFLEQITARDARGWFVHVGSASAHGVGTRARAVAGRLFSS